MRRNARAPALPWHEQALQRAYLQAPRLAALPRGLLEPASRLSGRVLLRLKRNALRRSLLHAGRALPTATDSERLAIVRRAAAHFGQAWADWMKLPQAEPETLIARYDLGALELPIRSGLAAGTGAIVVTASIGNWEALAGALAAASGDVMLVSRRGRSGRRMELVDRLRRACGVRSCSYGSARVDAARWLRLNRVLVIVADGDAGREGIFLPFFGAAASVTPLPARLAADTGAPCVAAFCLREGPAYRTATSSLNLPAATDPALQLEALRRWVSLVEETVRHHPDQYAWWTRRWATRPARDPRHHPAPQEALP